MARRLALFAVLLAGVLACTEGSLAAAYARRGTTGAEPEDYLTGLTDQDLALAAKDRGIDVRDGATRFELRRIIREHDARADMEAKAESVLPKGTAPVAVRVQYCVGWGYRNAFGELEGLLKHNFGGAVTVEGDNYPPTPLNQALSSALMMAALGGFVLCTFLPGMLPQPVQQALRENKTYVYMGLFMLYQVAGVLVQTGAFEVEVDGKLIFSKLETGQNPNLPHIVRIVAEHIRRVANDSQ